MLDTIKNFGGIESPKDARDFKPEDILGRAVPTPLSYSTDLSHIPVYMQSTEPACGGHAGTTLFQALAKNGETLSPRFVYAMCKKIDGLPNTQGTTARAIMQVLQKYGVCTDALFPNDTTLSYADYIDTTKIPAAAYVDALTRRIGAYAQIQNPTYQSVKDNIFQASVVLILGQIGNEWWTPSWNAKDILPLRPPASPVSGHFWVDYGFDANDTYLRNSWSADWGNSGNGDYGLNYQPFIKEAWIASLPAAPTSPPTPAQIQVEQQQLSLIGSILRAISNLWKGRKQS